jgi:hypothetical protein
MRRNTEEYRQRIDKLLVVADESGAIMAAMWPGAGSEDVPTETEWVSTTRS